MAQKAVKKIGQYRLYKVEGFGIYEIYYGTKATGVHVENIAHKENFEWAVAEIKQSVQQAVREGYGIGVSN
jgi:nucleoside-triphosphatase THEP1